MVSPARGAPVRRGMGGSRSAYRGIRNCRVRKALRSDCPLRNVNSPIYSATSLAILRIHHIVARDKLAYRGRTRFGILYYSLKMSTPLRGRVGAKKGSIDCP